MARPTPVDTKLFLAESLAPLEGDGGLYLSGYHMYMTLDVLIVPLDICNLVLRSHLHLVTFLFCALIRSVTVSFKASYVWELAPSIN
jgi:hypothetical protein